jgi:hypothetical protein
LISSIVVRLRWLRRKLTRTHWAARFLGIRHPAGEADAPGLVIIQIDGLSRTQMESAMKSGSLPFLARSLQRGHFTLEDFYSGVPSTTPAVQAEVFYGVRSAVPAFEFLHRESGAVFRMNEAHAASVIESGLEKLCPNPLLEGGRAYSNIYRGGADHSHYCSQDLDPERLLKRLKPLRVILLCIVYAPKILRMAGLALLELGLAIVDMFRGLYAREDFLKELAFVPSRVLVCIVLREMIRFRVLLDLERGGQVIHANFLGYDEQAHRRGPDSAFAHWTLKGIDRAVRDICHAAGRSAYRDYEWIIHSDHGQERTVPYERKYGRKIDAALREVFSRGPLAGTGVWVNGVPEIVGNALDTWRSFFGIRPACTGPTAPVDPKHQIVLTALGPVGHLYFPALPERDELERHAMDLVATAGVPLVLLLSNKIPCAPSTAAAGGPCRRTGRKFSVINIRSRMKPRRTCCDSANIPMPETLCSPVGIRWTSHCRSRWKTAHMAAPDTRRPVVSSSCRTASGAGMSPISETPASG